MNTEILENYLKEPEIAEIVNSLKEAGCANAEDFLSELCNDIKYVYFDKWYSNEDIKKYIIYVLGLKYLVLEFYNRFKDKKDIFTLGSKPVYLKRCNIDSLSYNIICFANSDTDYVYTGIAIMATCSDFMDGHYSDIVEAKIRLNTSCGPDYNRYPKFGDFGPNLIKWYLKAAENYMR